MTLELILLVPVLVLIVVGLFAFAGCASFDAAESPPPPPTKPDPPVVVVPPDPPKVPPPVTITYPQMILAETGLRCYWRLSEAAGTTTALDSETTNQPQNGTYRDNAILAQVGALELGADAKDIAALFDGVGSHVNVGHNSELNPLTHFSVEAWVNPDPTIANGAVIVGSYEPALQRGYVLDVLRIGAQMTLRARVGNDVRFTEVEAPLGDGTAIKGWRYVVLSYDAGAQKATVYVRAGAHTATSDVPNPAGPVTYKSVDGTNGTSLRIGAGRSTQGDTLPIRFPFKGRIDEVALYDRALTVADVDEHYNKAVGL